VSAALQRPIIIGSGLIAGSHAKALGEMGIRPAAVWSPNPAHRERFAAQWGGVAAESLEAALDTPGATHAHVCTTPMQHLDPIRAAAERGLTIISEKPLAPTAAVAELAAEYARAAGVPGFINFNRRQDEGIQMLRTEIAAGTLGRPISVFGHYRQQWNASPSGWDWRYDPAQVGPTRTVVEIGSHWFDLAEFVLGSSITSTSALLSSMGERDILTDSGPSRGTPPNDDLFAALLRFDNGAVGQVYGTELSHGSFDEIELRVDGTIGSATWSSGSPNTLRIGNKTTGIRMLGLDYDSVSLASSIRAIYEGRAAERGVATFDDGLRNARTLDAINHSATTQTWKGIPS